jgi:HEAT repeat protein
MDNPQNPEPREKSFFGIIVHSFFIIPFLIAVFCVILFTAVSLLTREQQTAHDYLEDVRTGGSSKRWQAAFELSKILANVESIPSDDRFFSELTKAFKQSKDDDPRVRQYLALAMGRTKRDVFFYPLVENIKTESDSNLHAVIYALGMLQDVRAVSILNLFINHSNPRIRSVTVVALGNIGDPAAKEILKKSLNDSEANVQWGSAISLAKLKDDAGKKVLIQLLDRDYLGQFPEVDPQEQNQLILTVIDAASFLERSGFVQPISQLAASDVNMKVRAAALRYLENEQ